MKQKIIILFTALILCIGTRAETIQVINGLKYSIYIDENYAILINNNYTLSDIVIPASISWNGKNYPVTKLGNRCFSGCSSLTSVTIPSSVTSLGEMCFAYSGLTSVTIPSSVKSLGYGCFAYSGLTSVTIPSSVTSLGKSCFSDCSSLTSVTILSSVKSLEEFCFYNCTNLKSIIIPSSVTSLKGNCFDGCSSLISVTIPSSVKSLGEWCFQKCTSLKSVTIPYSVLSLGRYCFSSCENLKSVNIFSPSIELGQACFSSTGIDEFTIMTPIPPSIVNGCFAEVDLDNAKLFVPKNYVNNYKNNSDWLRFGYILPFKGSEKQCETPHISYTNGILQFNSSTPKAEYYYIIKAVDKCKDELSKNEVSLNARYDISCCTAADGYTPSEIATAKLYWISANIETDGIAPATQMRGIVVSTEGGIVTLSGLKENERVTFYNVSGIKLGETRAMNGQASISATDDVIIARIGSQSIKVKQ